MTTPAHNIQQFVCDCLLAGFIVLQCQFLDQVVGIVVGRLHGEHAGGMFSRDGVEQSRVDMQVENFGQQQSQ